MLTQSDVEIIENIIDEKLDEKFKNYPTKDDLYKRLDHIVGKLDKIETELELAAHTQEEHGDRLTKLEKIHPQNKHTFAIAS